MSDTTFTVITNIDFVIARPEDIKRMEYHIAHANSIDAMDMRLPFGPDEEFVPARVVYEAIRGRQYVRYKQRPYPDNNPYDEPEIERIIVGISGQAERVLGISYDAFDSLVKDFDSCQSQLSTIRQNYESLQFKHVSMCEISEQVFAAPWWKRLWWVFVGISV